MKLHSSQWEIKPQYKCYLIKIPKMEGILYLTDEHNKKKFVQIDLEKYGKIWEDFYDVLMAEIGEESYPLEDVISELEKEGNLDKYV